MIRVFVADDHAIVRDGLERLLHIEPDFEFAGSSASAKETLTLAATSSWDVLVLDLSLPGGGGFYVLEHLPTVRPDLPVVVFTMHNEYEFAQRVLSAGAFACLSKTRPIDELIAAVREAHAGRRTVTSEAAQALLASPDGAPHTRLTDRELQVFMLLASGMRPSDVAAKLGLSKQTVSTHARRIRDKLAVESQAEMARYAMRHGLLE